VQISKIFASSGLGPKVRDISLSDRERLFFLMAQMLRSGQTSESGLRAVAKAFKSEGKDDVSAGLLAIAQKVAQGKSLSKAAEIEYIMFTDVHRAAIMAGEASNNMYEAFSVLRKLEDKKMQSQRAGMAEMLTPTLMFLLSLASIFNTGLNTMPNLLLMRKAQGKDPNMVSEFVMNFTHGVADHWHLIFALIVIGIITMYSTVRTTQGKFWLDYYLLKVPLLGKYSSYKVYTNMLLYFPHLIRSGVKPKQMIPIMEALATNVILRRRIDLFNQVITTGGQMSEAMDKAGFPPIAVTPVKVSENYAGNTDGVNDVMVEGMDHAYTILDRLLTDANRRFVGTFSATMWILGGCTMLLEMLSIVFAQS
jgi:type IV pilus assembly protein PilC